VGSVRRQLLLIIAACSSSAHHSSACLSGTPAATCTATDRMRSGPLVQHPHARRDSVRTRTARVPASAIIPGGGPPSSRPALRRVPLDAARSGQASARYLARPPSASGPVARSALGIARRRLARSTQSGLGCKYAPRPGLRAAGSTTTSPSTATMRSMSDFAARAPHPMHVRITDPGTIESGDRVATWNQLTGPARRRHLPPCRRLQPPCQPGRRRVRPAPRDRRDRRDRRGHRAGCPAGCRSASRSAGPRA